LLAWALASAPASAGDGVIEINAVAAQQGGITDGDSPGFPVTLSKSGSYRLTGDLLSSSQAVPVVDVTANRVNLDLAGFTIGACVGGGVCATGTAHAIDAFQSDVRIHDGVVRDAGAACIRAGSRASLENLHIVSCAEDGVSVSTSARVVGVTVSAATRYGVSIGAGSLVTDSVITGSGSVGVRFYENVLVIDSVIDDNDGAFRNEIFAPSTRGGYRGCVITKNDGEEEVQPISPSVQSLGGNICGTDTVCP
jgi:hypothetical protein